MTSKTHPTVESVEQALGSRSKLFAKLLATHPELKPEWKYYGEKELLRIKRGPTKA